jgi:hypothetical protein
MLRLAIKYTALGTLLMALIGSPGLSKAFAMGGGGGGGTGYGTAERSCIRRHQAGCVSSAGSCAGASDTSTS